ncbi:hypothetical protein BMI91_19480 [Thioclava sediminum]|uniref:Phage protein n=1 Tax=Thioclava sediminum TaxID=1915319 RepID=A0ABX3MRX8_9RHOB|nr:hypothetical protein [Thioclava sediminum]OOY22465.1 hypothetical protein BMI91_19480 [Thioclava sediminum]
MKTASEFKAELKARVDGIQKLPTSWKSLGSRVNGDVWKMAARKAHDTLIAMISQYSDRGYDWFDAQFEVLIVEHYNDEMIRRAGLEDGAFNGTCECSA